MVEMLPTKLDVTMSTFNSAHKLKECIESVIREVPVNKIIVVDGGSSDSTIQILRQYPQVELWIRPDLNLGQSREFGFSKVTTEWFVQIDSDIVLRQGWFGKIVEDLAKGDVVEGRTINHLEISPENYGLTRKFRTRAFFFNCLIRTEAVKGVRLNCLHLEDELTRRYVEKRGHRWYKSDCLLADHYSRPVRYRGMRPVVLYRSYPAWVYTERGRVDAMTGVSWLRLVRNILLMTGGRILTILGLLGNPVRDSLLYLQGYAKERKSGRWRI